MSEKLLSRKPLIIFAVFLLLLATVTIVWNTSHTLEKKEKVSEKEGVYYEALSKENIGLTYAELGQYAYDSLLYHNKIYTSDVLNYKQYSTKEFRKLFSDMIPLGKVYHNHGVYAATDSSALYEVTGTGTLFLLEEYQEDDRIGVYYHYEKDRETGNEEHYCVKIYDCLNDIYVKQGKDVFQTRFGLRDAKSIETFSGYDEEGERKVKSGVTFQNASFSRFYDAICKGKFLTSQERDEKRNLWANDEEKIENSFLFTDKYGIQTELSVYEEGYVIYRSPENTEFVVFVGREICEEIFKLF